MNTSKTMNVGGFWFGLFKFVFCHYHCSDTESTSICISLDEINSAFRQARLAYKLLEPSHFSPLKAHQHHHEIDHLGNVLVETSRILAKDFNLDHEQIFDMLPKLDVELTDIWKFCPAIFKTKKCKVDPYISINYNMYRF